MAEVGVPEGDAPAARGDAVKGEKCLNVDEIEARANQASPGPWRTGRSVHRTVYVCASSDGGFGCLAGLMDRPCDGRFVAHAREDVPALVAEVRRLRALLEAK